MRSFKLKLCKEVTRRTSNSYQEKPKTICEEQVNFFEKNKYIFSSCDLLMPQAMKRMGRGRDGRMGLKAAVPRIEATFSCDQPGNNELPGICLLFDTTLIIETFFHGAQLGHPLCFLPMPPPTFWCPLLPLLHMHSLPHSSGHLLAPSQMISEHGVHTTSQNPWDILIFILFLPFVLL